MPRFGLFFGGVYVLAGLAIGWATMSGGNLTWLIPAIAGFPLVAPFVAIGLYEASRRRAGREPLTWRAVLGAQFEAIDSLGYRPTYDDAVDRASRFLTALPAV